MVRTNMQWVAVRCCCTAPKVLGFLRLPVDMVRDGHVLMVRNTSRSLVSVGQGDEIPTDIGFGVDVDVVSIRSISQHNAGTRFSIELAVYSDDRPIEWWRQIEGFVEAAAVDSRAHRT